MKKKTDTKTLELIQLVNKQKAEISKAEKSNWQTNCSFAFEEKNANRTINLKVESDVRELILIGVFLNDKHQSFASVVEQLGMEPMPFKWKGFTKDEWFNDIKLRIAKIQVEEKKKKIEEAGGKIELK